MQKQRLLRHVVQQPICMWKMFSVQSVIAWGRFYGFCKRHYRRICTLLHAQKSTRKAPATFEAREARIKGCSPLIIPKQFGSIQKIQVAALEDFLCSADFEVPQPLRRQLPTGELICKYKNNSSAIIAKANAAAMQNRCCSVYTSHPPCARMKPTNQRR